MISIDNNKVMIEHYKEVIHVTSSEIKLQMKEYILVIKGENLHITAMSKYEIFIMGDMKGIVFEYEK